MTNSKQTKVNYLLLAFGYLPSVVTFELFFKATAGQIEGLNLLDVEAEIRMEMFSIASHPLFKAPNSTDVTVSFS